METGKTGSYRNDGYIEITLDPDNMSARALFHPPIGDGKAIDMEYAGEMLRQAGVVHGIDEDLLQESVFKANTEKKLLKDVKIACGTEPKKEVPPYIKLEKRLFEQPNMPKEGRIDFREFHPWILVHKQEKLGEMVPRMEGEDGLTVTGESVPFQKKDVVQFTPGQNTRIDGQNVIAICDGIYRKNKDRFWIDEVLILKKGVDYHTGHIKFPGDIQLTGTVQDGFNIYSGGSLRCTTTLDASKITVRKDIFAQAGIIGRRENQIRIGGGIESRFISHCSIKALQDINVKESVYNSVVFTLKKVLLGEHGKIVGGYINAVEGVDTYDAGNSRGTATYLICGSDFVVERKIQQVQDKIFEVENRIIRAPGYENERYLKIRNMLSATLEKLTAMRHPRTDAEIVIRNNLYPGCIVEICGFVFESKETVSRVKIGLDAAANKIRVTPL